MKSPQYLLYSLLFFFVFISPIFGQNYLQEVRHYSIEKGLSHSQILDIHKDSKGMMWVLAKDKMNRFDGQNFKAFSSGKQFYAYARIIGEDASGDIWIAEAYEQGDLTFFNTQTETFLSFEEKFSGVPELNKAFIDYYFISKTGDWYFGNSRGQLWRFNPTTKKVTLKSFGAEDLIVPFFENDEGAIWVRIRHKKDSYSSSTLLAIDKNGIIIHEIHIDNLVTNFNPTGTKEFSFSSIDTFFTVDKFGKTKKYPLSNFSKTPNDSKPLISPLIRYDATFDQYWMINEFNKILVFHPERGLLQNVSKQFSEIDLYNINGLFLDENGILWMGTIDGLYEIKCRPNDFQQYLSIDLKNKKSQLASCRGIVNNIDGDVVINSTQGVFLIEYKNSKEKKEAAIYPKVAPFNDYFFLGSLIDAAGNRWTASPDSLLKLKDNKIVQSWRFDRGMTWNLFESKNRIWMAVDKPDATLQWVDLTTNELHTFDQYNGFDALKKCIIYAVQKSSEETFWVVTNRGLFLLDEQTGIQAQYWTGGEKEFYIPTDDLKHLQEDNQGIIWLASSQGLIRWDRENNTHQQFTIEDGLSHNNIYAVYEDDFGFLWMSSDYGINQFQKSTGKIRIYVPSDGISHHEFNRISHLQVNNSSKSSQNGTIYFGGLNGTVAFHPKDFVARFNLQPDIPLALLEANIYRTKTEQEEDIKEEILNGNSIVVNPGDQSLNIAFALLDYENSNFTKYEYQFSNINKNWSALKTNNLSINGLPYGKHELVFRAKTANGQYSLQELSIEIHVLKPFYLQGWFLFLSFCFLSGMILLIYNWRTNELVEQKIYLEKEVMERTKTIAKQTEELQNLDKIKSGFFANVSHELRTPLTLILAPLNTVLKRKKIESIDAQLISTAHQNAQSLLKLTNEILDLTKLEAMKMELNETPIYILQETRRIFSFFETQAFQKGITFRFLNEINPALQILLDKDKYEVILNNLLSNALKFTSKEGKVILQLENDENHFIIKVIDTGKGISPADLPYVFERFYQSKEKNAPTEGGTGIGLALCRAFSKLFNGEIWVESELGKGSTFTFKFPMKVVPVNILPKENTLDLENTNDAIPDLVEEFKASILDKEILDSEQTTVLVVEDNHDLRSFLKLILQKKYNVLTAENGQVGWDMLQKNKNVHLILSDVMMPIMDGFQFLEKIKSDDVLASIPVVMLTARVELQDKLRALRIGVDDYILKPFEEEELLIRIQNLLKNAATRKIYQKEAIHETAGAAPTIEKQYELTDTDRNWLTRIEEHVLKNISKFDFNAEVLAQNIFLSRRQLDRRLKVMAGLTTGEYIREAKLQEARKLIESRSFLSVKEVAFEVGIKSVSHFSKQYKTRFGKSPSELMR